MEVRVLSRAPKLTFSEWTAPRGLAPALRGAKSAFVLEKLANALDVSVDELLK